MENKREHYEEFNINSRIIELAKTAENTVKTALTKSIMSRSKISLW